MGGFALSAICDVRPCVHFLRLYGCDASKF
jgi:hypothetical protein